MGKLYSSILKHAIIPVSDLVMGTSITSSARLLTRLKSFTPEEVRDWQLKRLSELLKHAYDNTFWYRQVFKDSGITPGDIRSLEDLVKLPVLSKEQVREKNKELIPINISSFRYKNSATGGSTGDPLKYLLDYRSWSMVNANSILNWERTGYHYGDKYIALGSSYLYVEKQRSLAHSIYYRLKSKTGLNGINMSDETCERYVSLIRERRIHYIYGYASSIYLLAKYVLEKGYNTDIRACFPTSEVLTERYRDTIARAFRCKILDCYGANDGAVTAFAHQEGIYEVGYNTIIRTQDYEEPGCGPALLTDLFNYTMPLINYRLGDEIRLDLSGNNSYNGQVISKVLGRTSDIIELGNGRRLTGPGFTILFKDLPVEHYFIKLTGVNSVECRIVRLPGFGEEHESLIASIFRKQMGEGTEFKIVYTTEIPLSTGGKRLYFSTFNK
jgi:phenylacetate-CoA ligase